MKKCKQIYHVTESELAKAFKKWNNEFNADSTLFNGIEANSNGKKSAKALLQYLGLKE